MKIDFKGRIGNVTLPASRPLLPVFEAVINGIDAVEDAGVSPGEVTVLVQRNRSQQVMTLEGKTPSRPIQNFIIRDNGIGFTQQHFDSFETSDSTLKSDRGAKGIGRFLWLKAFGEVRVESVFLDNGKYFERTFRFGLAGNGVANPQLAETSKRETGSAVMLLDFMSQFEERTPRKAQTIADKLIEHCLVYFLDKKCPHILLMDDDEDEPLDLNQIFSETIRPHAKEQPLKVGDLSFALTHLRIYTGDALHHTLHLCANNRDVVSINLYTRFPFMRQKLKDEDGKPFVYVAYLSGTYLDQRVNPERTGFSFVRDGEMVPKGELTEAALVGGALEHVRHELAAYLDAVMDEAKEKVVTLIETKYPEYRPLLDRIVDHVDEIPVDDGEEAIVLKLNEIQLKEDFKAREEGQKLIASAPDSVTEDPAYEAEVNDYLQKVTETSKTRLAQYVIHRKVILELLRKRMEIGGKGKYRKEEEIHKVIFPMRKTSNEISWEDQNLWIIDEKLVYHMFLASDKPLSRVEPLEVKSDQRPDLLLLNRPGAFAEGENCPLGSVVIIEFKRPDRTDFDRSPIDQVYGYIRDILDGKVKTKAGRTVVVNPTTPFFGYIICDLTPAMRDFAEKAGLTTTPDGLGYFGFNKNFNAYVELISLDKLAQDSEKRNHVLFQQLRLIPS
jgi:hypothetical protein